MHMRLGSALCLLLSVSMVSLSANAMHGADEGTKRDNRLDGDHDSRGVRQVASSEAKSKAAADKAAADKAAAETKQLEEFLKTGPGLRPPTSLQSTPDEQLIRDKTKALKNLDETIKLDTLKGLNLNR